MFDWLAEEMVRIKTRKFHLVDGAASAEIRKAVGETPVPIPPSYREFIIRFGNAKLYRQGSSYLVQVFAVPREAQSDDGESLLHCGRTDMSLAYFKESLLVRNGDSPVFEWRHQQGLQKTADGFEEWLKAKCASARRQFKKRQWAAIEEGPPPFNDKEQAIIEARKQFRWRVVGIAPNGDLQFEVFNRSGMILPYLTVGGL